MTILKSLETKNEKTIYVIHNGYRVIAETYNIEEAKRAEKENRNWSYSTYPPFRYAPNKVNRY